MTKKKGEKQPQQQGKKRKRNPGKKQLPDESFLSSSATTTDHYKILGVNRYVSEDELKKAYKKLIIIWHPDKHPPESQKEAEAKFKDINHAYQILGDPLQRRNYDALQGKMTQEEEFNSMFGFGFGLRPRTEYENTIVYTPIECTLEELYHGTTKKMKMTNAAPMVEDIMSVKIKPGYLDGTKFTFLIPGDTKRAGYVIHEKPHSVYKRKEHDLIVHKEITLLEALTGGRTLELMTLDGRKLMVPLADDVTRAPGDEMVVPGEGMPILKQPGEKGNLRIKFSVKFPTGNLTAEQRLGVKKGLEGVSF